MSLQPRYRKGDHIGGRYLVHQALMGGMGEVYLCLDLESNLPYALKTFQQRYLTNPRVRALFAHEVGTWVALEKHPNIIRCFYMDTVDNQPFMFLEWVAGEEGKGTDLRSWLRRGPLDLRTVLDFTIDICRGLIHAQANQPGIVHRDLKPDNILIAPGRVVKITDFGLATLLQQTELDLKSEASTDTGRQTVIRVSEIVGTPPYMAPEQWTGERGDVRIDIYAVGCILYELFTGTSPYQASTLASLQQLHTMAALPVIPTTESHPGSLNELLSHCLAKTPDERFANPVALLDALTQVYRAQFECDVRVLPVEETFTAADYSNRGLTYNVLGRYQDALADLTQAIARDPAYALAYSNRGNTYDRLGRTDAALADYTQAITLDPALALAYSNRGATYAKLGRVEEALADYTQAITLDPAYAPTYSNRGNSYEKLGWLDEALADFTTGDRARPRPCRSVRRSRRAPGKSWQATRSTCLLQAGSAAWRADRGRVCGSGKTDAGEGTGRRG